jgi:branched-chain amino acid transport system permease protein
MAVLGILIDKIVYRPHVNSEARPLIQLLSSLGLYIVVVNIIALFYGNETKVLLSGLQPTLSFGPVILTRIQVIEALSSLLLFSILLFILRRTKLGTIIRAMRDNPELVSALGIDSLEARRIVFALGSALASIAAILTSLEVGMNPNVGIGAILNGMVAMIIGGAAVFEGAVLGAFLLGIVQSLVIWQASAQWQDTFTFLLLTLFLLFRPEGILGVQRRVEERLG